MFEHNPFAPAQHEALLEDAEDDPEPQSRFSFYKAGVVLQDTTIIMLQFLQQKQLCKAPYGTERDIMIPFDEILVFNRNNFLLGKRVRTVRTGN